MKSLFFRATAKFLAGAMIVGALLFLFLSMGFVLGSPVSVAILLFYLPIIVMRIKNEERVLEEGLAGYPDYRRKVKAIPHNATRPSCRLIFRLFPRRNLEKPPVFLRFLSKNRQKIISAICARELCGIALNIA